jgi:hypothetical protein
MKLCIPIMRICGTKIVYCKYMYRIKLSYSRNILKYLKFEKVGEFKTKNFWWL